MPDLIKVSTDQSMQKL